VVQAFSDDTTIRALCASGENALSFRGCRARHLKGVIAANGIAKLASTRKKIIQNKNTRILWHCMAS
jgi:uncharacterized protein YggL (DUF469 family)